MSDFLRRLEVAAESSIAFCLLFCLSTAGFMYVTVAAQTTTQRVVIVGVFVSHLLLLGIFRRIANAEHERALDDKHREWCDYHDGALVRVRREQEKLERKRQEFADLYAKMKEPRSETERPPVREYTESEIETLPIYEDTAVPMLDFGESDTVIDLDANGAGEDTGITEEMVFEDSDLINPEVEDTPPPPEDDDKKTA